MYKTIKREDIKDLAPLVYNEIKKNYEPNPILQHSIPYYATFDEDASGSSEAVIPASSTIEKTITNDASGVIDIRQLAGISTGDYLVSIYDNEYQRVLSNRPLHSSTIIGTSSFPFKLPTPLILHKTQSLRFYLTDLSGASNSVRITCAGIKYYFDVDEKIFSKQSKASQISRPYFYTTDNEVNLSVSTAVQAPYYITTLTEADFYLYRITSKQDGPFLVRITNTSTGMNFSNNTFIHSDTFSGTSQNYKDMEPMLIERKTILKLEFINLHTAVNNVYITLTGVNYYYDRS